MRLAIDKRVPPLTLTGITLVELMVASVILSLVAITVIQGFWGVGQGVVASRYKTLATRIGSDRIQSLKSIPYYRLRVSSQTVTPTGLSSFDPAVESDELNYPSSIQSVNGIRFTAYTVVYRMKKNSSDTLEVKSWNTPDTGIKMIKVDVVWTERGEVRRLHLSNLQENPSSLAANGDFVGTVTDTIGAAVDTALIEIAENSSLSTLTDASGSYRLGAPLGTYTLRASKRGFFTKTIANQVITSTTSQVTVNFTNLVKMSSGTISGTLWHNDHLVISRICGQKNNTLGSHQEYVEVFNPTTWTWTMDGQVGLAFQRQAGPPIGIAIDYSPGVADLPPGKFYLFADQSPLDIDGVSVVADAVWDHSPGVGACNPGAVINADCFPTFSAAGPYDIIPVYDATLSPTEGVGALSLIQLATASSLDTVGWTGGGGAVPTLSETSPVFDVTGSGLQFNEVYYRKSSTTSALSTTLGPAYDGGDNSLDWNVYPGFPHPTVRNGASASLSILAGVPSIGAYVFANDGLSQTTQATASGSPPVAAFTLSSIATGTWSVSASLNNYYTSFSTTVTAGVHNSTSCYLSAQTIYGYVSGTVKNGLTNAPIAGITVNPGGVVTNALGQFSLTLLPGVQLVAANPAPGNSNYSESTLSLNVLLGQSLSGNTLYINPGGKLYGKVTIDGVNPLPDVPVSITNNVSGATLDTVTTASDGTFSVKVPVGFYNVLPVMEYGESVSPVTSNVSVASAGSSVFTATYTVTSAFGTLVGSATVAGAPITTGVLIVASTGTIPLSPPDLNAAFRSSGIAYYSGLSNADGSYTFALKNGTYTVSGWYTTFLGDVPQVTRKDYPNVVIQADAQTSLSLTW